MRNQMTSGSATKINITKAQGGCVVQMCDQDGFLSFNYPSSLRGGTSIASDPHSLQDENVYTLC